MAEDGGEILSRFGFLQRGRFVWREGGSRGPDQLRHYDRESLESLLEEAGFALGRLERHQIPIEAFLSSEDLAVVPPELLESVSKEPEATTSHFIALAYPLPNLSLDWLRGHMRRLAQENDAARRELADLRALPPRLARTEKEGALLREALKAEEKCRQEAQGALAVSGGPD